MEGMEDTGYEDYFFGQGVCLVEWAELIEELLPQQVIWIKIQKEEKEGKETEGLNVKQESFAEIVEEMNAGVDERDDDDIEKVIPVQEEKEKDKEKKKKKHRKVERKGA